MAILHVSKVFAIKEARIAKLLTDPPAAPPATWGTSVPLTGAKKLTISGTVDTKYLRGDNVYLDSDTVWAGPLNFAIDHAKLNLDALAVLFSTAVVDSGVTPNQLATWAMLNTDVVQYFKLEARSASADILTGDVLFSFWKCKLTAFPTLGLAEEDYQIPALAGTAVPLRADGRWFTPVIRETAVALA